MYREGHIKRDPASGAVAIRTTQDEVDPAVAGPFFKEQTWLAATMWNGPKFLGTAIVESWDDLYIPPDPE